MAIALMIRNIFRYGWPTGDNITQSLVNLVLRAGFVEITDENL